jgi:hypothetical protein
MFRPSYCTILQKSTQFQPSIPSTSVSVNDIANLKFKQKYLASKLWDVEMLLVMNSMKNVHTKRLLDLAQAQYSGLWLSAIPIPSLRLNLRPLEFINAFKYYFGIPIFEANSQCNKCRTKMDEWGVHAINCKFGGDPISRHNYLRDILWRLSVESNYNARIEEKDLIENSNQRPGDVFYSGWSTARDLCVDISVVDGFGSSSSSSKSNLDTRANQKIKKYKDKCQEVNVDFTPFVLDSVGGFHDLAMDHMLKGGVEAGRSVEELQHTK